MKIKTTPVIWIIFFVISLIVLNEIAQQYIEPREIVISQQQAQEIGEKIWQNEGAGKTQNLIVWNKNENFPSLGIGHFIWYPEGVEHQFQESFPSLIQHISKTKKIPQWLIDTKYPPWNSRESFNIQIHSTYTRQLREFLQETTAEQTQFIVQRLEEALPTMLKTIKSGFARQKVRENFYHIAMQKNGIYALVDYVNFKGEGVSPKEKYNNQGWGLLQVLENMNGRSEDLMLAFVESADRQLTRRVANAPGERSASEKKWLPGWRKRLQTYLTVDEKS
ncbi:MAG: hypothetical protein OEX07_06120 [Gammaproteobacteria bacterium]|nr:hypothetical protein [Gammaproteobacteria bacterium]